MGTSLYVEDSRGKAAGRFNEEALKAYIEENFAGKDLIIVSNREPYVHKRTSSGVKVESPAGGLTSAMDDVLRSIGGTWVAWGSGSADREASIDSRVKVPPGKPSYTLRRVWLSHSLAENYYHGYSNQVLWPLCHLALDRVYIRKKFWEDYERANLAFASAVLEEASPGSIVWTHDYHLCLAPRMMREADPSLTLVHFWHIPWPDWGVFRVCPQAREILAGLLANDLIGFQIPLFVKNFMDCASEALGAEVDAAASTVTYEGHTTLLKAFPISIDFEKFDIAAKSKQASRLMARVKKKYGLTGLIGVGVDRLEYTKALLKRLQAIDLFFDKYDSFVERFTFVQVAVATRLKEPYLSYKLAVEGLVHRINKKHSTKRWKPIVYIDTKISQKDLAAYYRMADVAVVSSIYDGMNLVAKEFVASQADEKGVLILSELAGAADALDGAILVNPYDVEGFAERIKAALRMPPADKSARMAQLRRQVGEHDIYRWISDILSDMSRLSGARTNRCPCVMESFDEAAERLKRGSAFLFLDYDGTLTPIVSTPGEAVLSEEMRSLVERLSRLIPIAVISGRSLEDVMELVGVDGLIYSGNHGAEVWDGEKRIMKRGMEKKRAALSTLLEKLRERVKDIPGVIVEDKGVTASVHFRLVSPKDLSVLFDAFSRTTAPYENDFRITSGKKVFEIRPKEAWNKGDVVRWISRKFGEGRTPYYLGDDTTDEDAYRAIKGKGVSISIGASAEADYCLGSQHEVGGLLERFVHCLERKRQRGGKKERGRE